MRIGIITVPDAANFGSYLQAYSLQIVLERAGHDVFFVRAWDKKYVRKLFYTWIPKKRHLKHPVLFLCKNFFGKKSQKEFEIDHKNLNLLADLTQKAPDLVLLGSDEIWNVRTDVFRRKDFYGAVYKNVAAYAVSAGEAQYSDFCNYPSIISQIQKIEDIYVRDDNTAEIVGKITGQKPEKVCDPTFLVKPNEYCEKIKDEYLENNRYIVVYSYSMSISKKNIKIIKEYAKSINCKLVSPGLYNRWCDYNLVCKPTEFSSVIANAECVITNTFHGTVFSILNQKQFVSIGKKIKICDLLNQFGLINQLVDADNLSLALITRKIQEHKIDYNAVGRKIDQFRTSSLQCLQSILDKYNSI